MQLFFNSEIQNTSKEHFFSKEESKHIVKVLRKKIGDQLYITNGKGTLFTAEILIDSDKKCVVKIIEIVEKDKEWNYNLHIAIAPTKNMDRLEWFIEKATEIGIDEITPILCDNSERKVVKIERLEKIMLSAVKQSLKFTAPIINKPIKFKDFISTVKGESLLIAHCEEDHKVSLKEANLKKENIVLLIGPEGDFSLNEINKAKENNFLPVTLGKSRLRTETAGIVATHSVNFLFQEMQY
jgi:16S rRNA (uracil1498-N3)-methyltransferase